jgi:hypothetical protein
MRKFISKEKAIIEAAAHLCEKCTISKADALKTASSLADRMFGHVENVDEARLTPYIDALLRAEWAKDEAIDLSAASFSSKRTPLQEAIDVQRKVDIEDLATQTLAGILPTAAPVPTSATPTAFGSSNPAFQAAIRPTSPAAPSYAGTGGTTLPAMAAAPRIGVVPVIDLVQPREGLSLARKMEIQAEVARDLSVCISKALAAKPVAKTSGTARTVKIIKAGV